jgi:HEAT repeat protein
MKRLVLGLVALALVAGTAWAHGGNYRGPGGEVPPNMRKPEDPPPPSDSGTPTPPPEEDPGGTPTPPDGPGGGGRPDAPPPPSGDDNGGPGKVLPPAAGGGGSGGGTATPGGGKRVGPPPVTFDSWEFWWGYNKDDILNLKAALQSREGGSNTVGAMVGVGRSHERTSGSAAAPTIVAIKDQVIPALEKILDQPKLHFDIRAAAVIALGKIGASFPKFEGRIAKRLVDIMNIKSGEEHFSVEESAALALGLLRSKDSEIVNALCDKALDTRKAFTKNERARAFALLALGLLEVNSNDETYDRVAETLRKAVAAKQESNDNIPVCGLMAMGLSGDPTFIDDLIPMVREGRAFKTTKLKDVVRSYAASAIGKIIDSEGIEFTTTGGNDVKSVVDVLSKAMISSDNHTVRSAVIAFGQIGSKPGVDAGIIKKMVRSLDYMVKKGESQAANFSLIALGKIGATVEDTGIRNKIFDTLRTNMKKGTYVSKPFAALALGLMGRSSLVGDSREAIKDIVRFEFREFRGDPKNRGGYAIALGMLRDRKAVPMLIEVLEDKGAVKRLRGACAVALGMIKDRSAVDAIKKALIEDKDPELRVDTAVAVGLIGDSESIKMLVDILKDPRSSLYVQGSVTLAVGRIGDKSAIEPLVNMMKSTDVQDLNRALAGVALGLLGDRQTIPVISRIAKDVNYRAMINAMEEVLSIL